jgi:hypothetical protein
MKAKMRKAFDAAASLPEPAPEPWCFVSRETAGEGRGEGGERKINTCMPSCPML